MPGREILRNITEQIVGEVCTLDAGTYAVGIANTGFARLLGPGRNWEGRPFTAIATSEADLAGMMRWVANTGQPSGDIDVILNGEHGRYPRLMSLARLDAGALVASFRPPDPPTPDELAESEARFRSTFENAAIGIAHVSPDGSWLRVNRRLCEIVGYTEAELRALTFQDITHPDDLEADLDYVNQVLRGEIPSYTMEKRYFHSSGHTIWIELTVALKRQRDGKPDFFISCVQDISDRKASERDKQYLTAELVHRSRNLLTVVQSIAALMVPTARSVAEFNEKLASRITGLARASGLIVNRAGGGTPIHDVIDAFMVGFVGVRSGRLSASGPDVELSSAGVQAIGLALHELMTNALKHGALATPDGHIALAWRLTDNPRPDFVIEWTETGAQVHPPEPGAQAKGGGFGSTVLETAAPATVDGKATLTLTGGGAHWRMQAPAARILVS